MLKAAKIRHSSLRLTTAELLGPENLIKMLNAVTGISYEDADHKRILKALNILNVCHLVELDTASLMYQVRRKLPGE